MVTFDEYYREHLGLNQENPGQTVFAADRRSEPVALFYLHHLISSVINDKLIHSISPQLVQAFKKQIADLSCNSISTDLVREIDDAMFEVLPLLSYSPMRMHRMTIDSIEQMKKPESFSVSTLTEESKPFFETQLSQRGSRFTEFCWKAREKTLQEGRYFGIIENDEIAATAFISDIDSGAGNLVVSTKSKYRRKGYGKAVVARATEWCFENKIRPIYLVAVANTPSVKLAEGLGFETKSEEIVVSGYIGTSV